MNLLVMKQIYILKAPSNLILNEDLKKKNKAKTISQLCFQTKFYSPSWNYLDHFKITWRHQDDTMSKIKTNLSS